MNSRLILRQYFYYHITFLPRLGKASDNTLCINDLKFCTCRKSCLNFKLTMLPFSPRFFTTHPFCTFDLTQQKKCGVREHAKTSLFLIVIDEIIRECCSSLAFTKCFYKIRQVHALFKILSIFCSNNNNKKK